MLQKHPLCVLLLVVLVSVSGDAIITSEVAVQIGDDATLDCTTANIVEANVTWYHNGRPVPRDGSLLHVRRSAILFLQNATLTDGGSYSCMMAATNVTLQSYSVVIGLPPRGPEIFQCRSNDFALVTCEWSRLPETHVRTDVECEFTTERDITNSTTWTKCLHFNASRGRQEFHDLPRFHVRLVLKNTLGVLVHTPEDGEFRVEDHTTPHPPSNVEIRATANCHGKSLLNVTWQNPADITEYFSNEHFGHFEVELTKGSAVPWNLTYRNMPPTQCMMWYPNMPMNEIYCVRVRFVSPKNGSWSERACSLRSPDEIACERGGRVQLACPDVGQSSTAASETAVAWYHNDILMPEETDTLLSITNISLEDGGNYSCMPGGGAQVASYNVMIGSKPQEISLECSSSDFVNIICKWDPIPDTNLPTNILCEYAEGFEPYHRSYHVCPNFSAGSGVQHFTGVKELNMLLRFANALGTLNVPKGSQIYFNSLLHTKPAAPVFDVNVKSTCQPSSLLNVVWTHPSFKSRVRSYLLEKENKFEKHNHTVSLDSDLESTSVPASVCNTEYCVRMKTITHVILDEDGPWSKQICVRTPPTVPNVVTTHVNYTDEIVKGKELRHVNVTWNVTENKNMPYQGLSGFRLQIVSSKSNHTTFLSLSEQFAVTLVHNNFSMMLLGLSVREKYVVYLTPFNTAGSSRTKEFTIASVKMDLGYGHEKLLVTTIPVLIVMAFALIFAFLACGYQRIKKDSQHFPDPVYPKIFQVKPPACPEPEVFDQLVCSPEIKEKCSAQILGMVSEDKEMYPLLNQKDLDISLDNQTYCKLSLRRPERPFNLHMATDVESCDYYPFVEEVRVKESSVDEGVYVGYLSSCSQRSSDESSDQDQQKFLSLKGPPPGFGGQHDLDCDRGSPVGDSREGGRDSGYIYSSLAQCADEESYVSSSSVDADDEGSLPSMQTALAHSSHQVSDTAAADPFWMANEPGPYVMAPSGQWEGPAVEKISRPSMGQDHDPTALICNKLIVNEKHGPISSPPSETIADYVTCNDIAAMRVGGKAESGDSLHRKPHSLQSSPQHNIRDLPYTLSSAQWSQNPAVSAKMSPNLQAVYVDSRDIPLSPSLRGSSSSEARGSQHSEIDLTTLLQDETTSAGFRARCGSLPIADENYHANPGKVHKMLRLSSSGYVSRDSDAVVT